MKVTAEFDETQYGYLCRPEEVRPLFEALNRLYGTIWVESCLDHYSQQTRELCGKLLDDIERCNKILKFKK